MSFRSKAIALVCLLGGSGLVLFFVMGPSAPEAPSPAHATPVTDRHERVPSPEARSAVAPAPSPDAPAPSAPPNEREEALRRRLEAAQQVVSVPPTGQRPSLAMDAQSLPPQVEAQRQNALLGWKQAAQQLMDSCAPRPTEARQPVALQVGFAPRPGPPGGSTWTFTPDWISIPPPELQRLWKDMDPEKLQACLDRARALPLKVTVPGDLAARDAPLFAESVLVQL